MKYNKDFNDAIFNCDLIHAKQLLLLGVNPNSPDSRGIFAIDAALNSGSPEVLRFIIDQISDINQDIGRGWTSLHLALDIAIDGMVQNNRLEPSSEDIKMITILIENGAKPDIKDNSSQTAIDILKRYATDTYSFNNLKSIFKKSIPSMEF